MAAAMTSGFSVTVTSAKKVLGEVYAITAYNGRNRLPTSGVTAIKRDKKEDAQPSAPIVAQAGWMNGSIISRLLDYTGYKTQLIETEQGGKYEFFLQPDNPDADNWLNNEQTERVLSSLGRQNVGIIAVFKNPQGLMLVLTPLSNMTAGEPSKLEFSLEGDALVLLGPAEE